MSHKFDSGLTLKTLYIDNSEQAEEIFSCMTRRQADKAHVPAGEAPNVGGNSIFTAVTRHRGK